MSEQTSGPTADQVQQLKRQQEALAMIIGAVRMAQKRGAFTLEEAAIIGPAVSVFAPPEKRPIPEPQAEKTEAETEE